MNGLALETLEQLEVAFLESKWTVDLSVLVPDSTFAYMLGCHDYGSDYIALYAADTCGNLLCGTGEVEGPLPNSDIWRAWTSYPEVACTLQKLDTWYAENGLERGLLLHVASGRLYAADAFHIIHFLTDLLET